MTQTIITIEKRDVYGKPVFYPVNPEAHWLADLAGSRTLTPNTLGLAERLGMRVLMATGHSDWRQALNEEFRKLAGR